MEMLCSLCGCFTAFERLCAGLISKPLRRQKDENQADDSWMIPPSPTADSLPEDWDVASYYPSESWLQEWLANEKTWHQQLGPDAQEDVLGGDAEGSTSTPDTLEGDLESESSEGDVSWHDEQMLRDKVQQQRVELTRSRRAHPPHVQELLQRARAFLQDPKDPEEPKEVPKACGRAHPPHVQELLQRAKAFLQETAEEPKEVPKELLTHFAKLGLDPNAIACTPDAVRKRYRWLAVQCHPDKHHDGKEAATKEFQELVAAYEAVAKHLACRRS
ncbi:dnajb6-b [Symbiodinium natans]|uniref:Dnajb6-b protein n=1 Tax=Symbiodinium natans TaxID=878477 RepID=A0A812IBE1_9DINO|nr:dnajb6-b [Symbiodinium natans]